MHTLAVTASVVLGLVFVVAGAAKVAQGVRWPAQAAQLGAPSAVAPVVPWWEIVVGALLVVQLGTPWPAIAALVTLVVFTALIGRVLARGEHPPCACFGGWGAAPLGRRHVVRNAALLVLAVLALFA
ncbi:MAG: MauE/DoxX family redox-associated membrane protein [Ilumatobacteraceae bacterium]